MTDGCGIRRCPLCALRQMRFARRSPHSLAAPWQIVASSQASHRRYMYVSLRRSALVVTAPCYVMTCGSTQDLLLLCHVLSLRLLLFLASPLPSSLFACFAASPPPPGNWHQPQQPPASTSRPSRQPLIYSLSKIYRQWTFTNSRSQIREKRAVPQAQPQVHKPHKQSQKTQRKPKRYYKSTKAPLHVEDMTVSSSSCLLVADRKSVV